jgi:hypothetical protein
MVTVSRCVPLGFPLLVGDDWALAPTAKLSRRATLDRTSEASESRVDLGHSFSTSKPWSSGDCGRRCWLTRSGDSECRGPGGDLRGFGLTAAGL